jgi:hypothetical protein
MDCKHLIGSLVRSQITRERPFARYIRLAEHVIIYPLLSQQVIYGAIFVSIFHWYKSVGDHLLSPVVTDNP